MHLTPTFWLRSPLTALLCVVLRLQLLLPRPFRALGKKRSRRRYSVVTAVYNAERWLPDYFTSILCQTLDVEACLKIICVDDGSTDASAAIIHDWQARYPGLITYIHKENGGPASARNLGVEKASGEWITFMDADDFLHPGYFAAVEAFLDANGKSPLGMIVCNYQKYMQGKRAYRNTHTLRERFMQGERSIPANDSGNFVHIVTNSAFFFLRLLRETGIRQREDVRPTFEDGEMVIRYVAALAERNMNISVLPKAVYYSRQQSGNSGSLTREAYHSAAYFDAPLALGCLRTLRELREKHESVPLFAQMTVLYSVSRYYYRIRNENAFAELPETARRRFFNLVREILAFIEPECIERMEFSAAPPHFSALLLGAYKNRALAQRRIFIERYDARHKSLRVFYYSRSPYGDLNFFHDGTPLTPSHAKTAALPAWDGYALYEHILWLPLSTLKGDLHTAKGVSFFLAAGGTCLGERASVSGVISSLTARDLSPLAWDQRLQVRLATSLPLRRLYGKTWLLMDRDTMADDNAEHLYRHIQLNHPGQRAYFILRKNSHDWPRLLADGFKLVPFGSLRHKIMLLNCERLVTSQRNGGIVRHLPFALTRHIFAYLGHGPIRADNSRGMNKLPIAFRPMSMQGELTYVAETASPFRLTSKEAQLTGMPRFDALFRTRCEKPERRILFMPTWRRYLTGKPKTSSNEKHFREGFADSLYARTITALLTSERLAALLEKYNYRLDIAPHTNMLPYFRNFPFGGRIALALQSDCLGIQDMFRKSRIVITDYSSIAFDAAFLGRALIYYQFDKNEPGEGDHYAPGYFDYKRHGFGPVTETQDKCLDELEISLQKGGSRDGVYTQRALAAFTFQDDGSCERVYKAIAAL